MSDLIDREALLRQIDIDSEGEPGYYGDTWKFIDTIKRMPSALGTNLAEVGTKIEPLTDKEQRIFLAAMDALKAIKYGLWEIDIPSPTIPEYVEHHEQIKNMMEIVDGWIERIQEEPPIQPEPLQPWEVLAAQAVLSQPAEPKRGRWIKLDMHRGMADHKCTACEQECYVPTCMGEPMYAYCPNCGAKMEVNNEIN